MSGNFNFVAEYTRKPEKKLMKPSTARILAAVFLVFGLLLGFFDAPQLVTSNQLPVIKNFPYRLGLDIQGGTHLVYEADVSNIASGERRESMEAVRDVIERRVNLFGVAEPVVQTQKSGNSWRLIVELAGVKDINAAIKLIGETPYLEFREESSDTQATTGDADFLFVPTALTGRYVKRAELRFDSTTSEPLVLLEFNSDGAKIFEELTRKNLGRQLAIFLDGVPISAPVVQQEISGGQAQISGNFTPPEARELVGRLNAGALPVPLVLIAQQSIGSSLGAESFGRSINAALFGFAAVILFMIGWYRLQGLMAVAALLFYAAVVLAIFKLIPVTLTVAGITGFILSVGMAVDANILVFERMKEEKRAGRTPGEALAIGFRRAWSSIRDSNVSSLITAAILYWVGTSVVQGFALTLGLGILVSMFSAMVVTKVFLTAVRNT